MDQLSAMRAFVRVAETGSFSVAARSSGTTQATISKRVAALEETLGIKLLIRSSREQALTEAGEEYLQRCIPILEAVDDAETMARCHSRAPRGLMRITTSVDFGRLVLAPLLRDFMALYPDIRIDLVLSNYYLDMIAGGIDVAIRAGHFEDSSLVAKPLGGLPLCLIATADYLLQRGTPEHPEELEAHECLLYSPLENPRSWVFNEGGKTFRVAVNGKFQCDNGEVILDMVMAGQGLALLPYWMVYEELQRGGLQLLLPEYAMPAGDLKMVYPERKHLPLKTRFFLDFMAEHTQEHPAFGGKLAGS
ncbi:MAG: LysR substrate-binding domain-containing protein [Thiolinea sp.]